MGGSSLRSHRNDVLAVERRSEDNEGGGRMLGLIDEEMGSPAGNGHQHAGFQRELLSPQRQRSFSFEELDRRVVAGVEMRFFPILNPNQMGAEMLGFPEILNDDRSLIETRDLFLHFENIEKLRLLSVGVINAEILGTGGEEERTKKCEKKARTFHAGGE